MKYRFLAVALLCTTVVYAEGEKDKAVGELPSQVKPAPDVVSLYADFDHPSEDKSISVYVINRSGQPLKLHAQDGDIYLKLEVHGKDGMWKRAQTHTYSWCGNSYMDMPVIRSEHFIKVNGYQPKEGAKAEVRYTLHGQDIIVSSNAGDALVSDKDVEAAATDVMSIREGDFDYVSKIALGNIVQVGTSDRVRDLRQIAISELMDQRFDKTKVEAVLREIAASKDEKYAKQADGELGTIKSRGGKKPID